MKLWKRNLIVCWFGMFVSSIGMSQIAPVLPLYISHLGIINSASGLANIIAAPRLGKLADKIGVQKVMLIALIVAGLDFIPQAFVTNPWQLMGLRFILGLTSAGLMPSVNILIKKITPSEITGRVFGINMSAGYLGIFGGAVLGGQVAAWFGIRNVFFITGALLLINAMLVYFKVYKRMNTLLN
ncbi:MAG: arabinose efflux permease family protein [Clostridium sp. Maddingley MBC34-26]|nr:MAG: arabinose efflux permease family protein [Clostridium sp. Maddingley MBC34-26]